MSGESQDCVCCESTCRRHRTKRISFGKCLLYSFTTFLFILLALVVAIFSTSFVMTLMREYQIAVAKHMAAVSESEYYRQKCREKRGRNALERGLDWVIGLVSFPEKDPCITYHEIHNVSPEATVIPSKILAMMLSECFFEPLSHLGTAFSEGFGNMFSKIPVILYIPALVFAAFMIVVIVSGLCVMFWIWMKSDSSNLASVVERQEKMLARLQKNNEEMQTRLQNMSINGYRQMQIEKESSNVIPAAHNVSVEEHHGVPLASSTHRNIGYNHDSSFETGYSCQSEETLRQAQQYAGQEKRYTHFSRPIVTNPRNENHELPHKRRNLNFTATRKNGCVRRQTMGCSKDNFSRNNFHISTANKWKDCVSASARNQAFRKRSRHACTDVK